MFFFGHFLTEKVQTSESDRIWQYKLAVQTESLVWKLYEIRHAKLLNVSEYARYQGTSEEGWRENVKEFCRYNRKLHKHLNHNQGRNNVLTSEQHYAMRELKVAFDVNSKMRRFRDLQKRKNGT